MSSFALAFRHTALPTPRFLATCAIVLVVYLLLDWGSYIYPFMNFNIIPWNPLAGFTIFVLISLGMRYIPILYAGRVLGDLVIRHGVGAVPVVLVAAAVVTGGYALAARWYGAAGGCDVEAPKLRTVTTLLLGAVAVTAAVASAYVGLLYAAGALPSEFVVDGILRRFVGDLIGIITLVPPLSIVFGRIATGQRPVVAVHWLGAVQAAVMLGVEVVIFGVDWIDDFKFFYLLFLPMMWMAVQGGFSGAAFGVLWTQVGLMAVIRGLDAQTGTGVTEIQVLMTTLAVTGLMLGTVVSERRDAETRLSESQVELDKVSRRSVSGELASVIAHELNQPLTALTNYARVSQMLHDSHGSDAMLSDTLEKTMQQATRAGEIVRRLRDFVGRGESSPEDLSLNDVVTEVIEMMSPSLRGARVALQTDLAANVPAIFADRLQIHQLVYNLARNAVEAMTAVEGRARRLRIETFRTDEGEAAARIVDSGPGLAADVRDRLFTPFVTSKPAGMGLGLSICKSIVAAHGGKLWHEPGSGPGAEFLFTIPAAQPGASHDC